MSVDGVDESYLLIGQLRSLWGWEVDMAALAWLLIPLVCAVGAGLWGSWAGRHRKIGDGPELAGYARFRAAMEKSALDDSRPDAANTV